MLQKIRRILLFKDFSRSDLKAVQPQIMEDNRRFCIIWAAVNNLSWIYCLIMTVINPKYHMCRAIYISAFAVCTVCLCLSIYAAPKYPGFIRAIAITMDETLLLAGIFIARHLAPQTIVVFASVLIVPVVFITNTFSTALMLLVNIIVFTQVGSRTMAPEIYRWVLSNLCIFSVVGVLIGHFVNKTRFDGSIVPTVTLRSGLSFSMGRYSLVGTVVYNRFGFNGMRTTIWSPNHRVKNELETKADFDDLTAKTSFVVRF